MTEPSLTVVVPSVNGLGDLMGCLAALSRQRTDVDLEVLVVDRCGEVLREEVRKTHPWVRVLEATPGTTIPDLRALAFREARGRSVAVIEDHVIVPPGWARALLDAQAGADVVVGGAIENAAVDRLVDWQGRFAGETKYPLRKMMRFAFDGLTSFSSAPLKVASHAGLVLSVGSLLLLFYIAYGFFSGIAVSGWTSLMLVVVFLGAVQMFVLALMGEYIGRLYNESKKRPLYIVQEVAGGEPTDARLGYIADATANSDKPAGKGKRPTR